MRIHIWCILAPVFLVTVKASLHDNVGQSFYETQQSSSPSPISEYSQSPQLDEFEGMKEIVLYLTPDQVNALQAAGAVVRPYPEDEVDFAPLDQQLSQSIKPERRQHYQMQWNPNQNLQLNPEIQNYHKYLNIQEINDNLSQTTEATIRNTERTTTTPQYRFTSTTTRPQFKEREYSTPAAPNRKASRTNYSNQNSNTEHTPFQYHYENANFRNTPSNIRTPDNSPSPHNASPKITPGHQTTPSFYSTPSPERTTHFEYYYENKKFRNTPSNILTPYNSHSPSPYNTPTPQNIPSSYSTPTPSPEITPNPYYTPSPKSTPNPYFAPSPKNTPSPYSTPNPNSSPSRYSTPGPYNSPSSDNTPSSYSTPSPYKTPTRLPQSLYQPEKQQSNNYFPSSKEIQGNQFRQSPSSTPSPYSTPRIKIIPNTNNFPSPNNTPSPYNTPKSYSTPNPYKTPTRLPQSLYQLEEKQPNNYFQSSKEIQENQYLPPRAPSPYSTPRTKIIPNPNNSPSPKNTPSPYKSPTRLPLSPYEPEKQQPNNYFQRNQYHQSRSSSPSPYNTPNPNNKPSPNNTPSPTKTPRFYSTPSPYTTTTRLPQSLYQPEEKRPNNYFQSSKENQGNQYDQSPSSTPSPYNTPSPNNNPSPNNTPSPNNAPSPTKTPRFYSSPSPYTTTTRLPQSLYQPDEKQPLNYFQPRKEIQKNQYQKPANQNAFSGTTGNDRQNDFTASNTNSYEDENVCIEDNSEPEQKATPPVVQIGNRKVNKYSARNVYKPTVSVRVQEAQESVKPQTFVEVPPSYTAKTSAPEIHTGLEDTTEHREPLNFNDTVSPRQEDHETPETPALPPLIRTPFEKGDYLSLLLAPLYKHQTISEIVSQHKDDLIRSESNINSKLQYLTKSHPYFNTKEHKAALEKSPDNFSQQIALAKHEATTRSPSVYENSETTETSSEYLAKTSEFPLQDHTSEPRDFISSPNPIPIELIRQFPTEEKVVNIGGGRNVFARTEKPLTIQTIAPLRLKHTTPESLPLSELESPIFRPIWEH